MENNQQEDAEEMKVWKAGDSPSKKKLIKGRKNVEQSSMKSEKTKDSVRGSLDPDDFGGFG